MNFDLTEFRDVLDRNRQNEGVFAKFYDKAVKTDAVHPVTGLPVFRDVCYVEIRLKNNMTDVYNQPATSEKIKRFPLEYKQYVAAKEQRVDGTPLEQFSFLTAAQIETLKCHGIFTVEALNALNEQRVADLGLADEHAKARLFLKMAENNTAIDEIDRLKKKYEAEIDGLKRQVSFWKKQTEQRRHK